MGYCLKLNDILFGGYVALNTGVGCRIRTHIFVALIITYKNVDMARAHTYTHTRMFTHLRIHLAHLDGYEKRACRNVSYYLAGCSQLLVAYRPRSHTCFISLTFFPSSWQLQNSSYVFFLPRNLLQAILIVSLLSSITFIYTICYFVIFFLEIFNPCIYFVTIYKIAEHYQNPSFQVFN